MGHTFNRPDEAAMLRILERHPHSPEGAILRLAWLEGLSRSEITELRWDQVDFEAQRITVSQQLQHEKKRNAEKDLIIPVGDSPCRDPLFRGVFHLLSDDEQGGKISFMGGKAHRGRLHRLRRGDGRL